MRESERERVCVCFFLVFVAQLHVRGQVLSLSLSLSLSPLPLSLSLPFPFSLSLASLRIQDLTPYIATKHTYVCVASGYRSLPSTSTSAPHPPAQKHARKPRNERESRQCVCAQLPNACLSKGFIKARFRKVAKLRVYLAQQEACPWPKSASFLNRCGSERPAGSRPPHKTSRLQTEYSDASSMSRLRTAHHVSSLPLAGPQQNAALVPCLPRARWRPKRRCTRQIFCNPRSLQTLAWALAAVWMRPFSAL